MAARGTEVKNAIFNKLKEVFPESFWEDEGKILRVPMDENGNRVEIKVTLTAAKSNLGDAEPASAFEMTSSNVISQPAPTEVTEEEKANVEKLLKSLQLPF